MIDSGGKVEGNKLVRELISDRTISGRSLSAARPPTAFRLRDPRPLGCRRTEARREIRREARREVRKVGVV